MTSLVPAEKPLSLNCVWKEMSAIALFKTQQHTTDLSSLELRGTIALCAQEDETGLMTLQSLWTSFYCTANPKMLEMC